MRITVDLPEDLLKEAVDIGGAETTRLLSYLRFRNSLIRGELKD